MTRITLVLCSFTAAFLSSCHGHAASTLAATNDSTPIDQTVSEPMPEFDSIPDFREDRLWVQLTGTFSAGGGDTIHATYVLHNSEISKQDVDDLDILTTVKPIKIITPGMRLGWMPQEGILQDSARIGWSAMLGEAQVAPGDSAAPFYYSAVGLLSIVSYHVHGHTPAATYGPEDEHDLIEHSLPYWKYTFRDLTVGVVPLPTDRSSLFLARRLRSLTDESCRLQWITAWRICGSIHAQHRAARQAVFAGDLNAGCRHINALMREVEAFPDSATGEARSLISLNAQYFLRTHCGQQR